MNNQKTIIAYKSFNPDWTCNDFQYEVGKSYEHKGKAKLCSTGFHACEVPFDAWNYYPHAANLARVQLNGVSDEHDSDSKRVACKITIEAKLSLGDWIKAQVKVVLDLCKTAKGQIADGGHAAATGDGGHAAATGYGGHAAATGDGGHAAATGDGGHAAATGYGGHAAATGDGGHAAATGYRGHAAATGYGGHAAATGDGGHAAATGYRGHAAVKGKYAIAAALGPNGCAQADENGWVVLAHWKWSDAANDWQLLAIKSAKVGEDGIKAGSVYTLNEAGEFMEAAE